MEGRKREMRKSKEEEGEKDGGREGEIEGWMKGREKERGKGKWAEGRNWKELTCPASEVPYLEGAVVGSRYNPGRLRQKFGCHDFA